MYSHMFLLGKGDSQACDYILLLELWPMVWLCVRVLKGGIIKKLERHFGERHMVDLSKWAKDVSI